jgi:hypothetical protein
MNRRIKISKGAKPAIALLACLLVVNPLPVLSQAVGGGVVVEPEPTDQVVEFVQGGRVHRWVLSSKEYCVSQKGHQSRLGKMPPPEGIDLLQAFKELNSGVHSQASVPDAIKDLVEPAVPGSEPCYCPVVYPEGQSGRERARGVLRPMVNLKLAGDVNLEALQAEVGATSSRWVVAGRFAVLEFADVETALGSLDTLGSTEGVKEAYPEISGRMKPMAIPSDPLFSYTPPRVNYQWHLRNIGANGGFAGVDVNITDVWDQYTGSGVVIGIVDDGLETFHPDLFLGVDFANDWDFNGNDNNPNPLNDTLDGIVDSHGTSVAGVAGARWNNGIGGVGSAPQCKLIGLRVLGDLNNVTEADFAAAVGWNQGNIAISNNSWGPANPTAFADYGGVVAAMETGVASGRGGKGRIFCFAAGNDGAVEGNTNHSNLTSAPESVVVGALNDDGTRSYLSTPGASLTISAPSGGSANQQKVTTTTLTNITNGYTDGFSGTSAATPLVSGCIALMLEANPNLGWRDVQEILIKTAVKNDPLHPDWSTNGAGFHFNHSFGAGMIDAGAAVAAAETWTNLGPRQMAQIELTDFTVGLEPDPGGATIPDGGLPVDFLFNAGNFTPLRVEHVILNLDIEHTNRAELEITLISPSGTSSLVLDNFTGAAGEQNIAYEFPLSTVRCWGEEFSGAWRVRVRDTVAGGGVGEILQAKITGYGTTPDGQPPRELPGLAGSRRLISRLGEFAVFPLIGTPEGATISITGGSLPGGMSFEGALGVLFGAPTEIGEFPVEVTVTNGPDSRVFIVIFVVGDVAGTTLGAAIEQTDASTTSSGNGGPWLVDTTVTFDGSDSAVSPGTLGHNFYSELQFKPTAAGVMVYAWRTSSEENRDRVWLYETGDPKQKWFSFLSGERDWGRVALPVAAGKTYRWRMERDGLGSFGSNQAWLDAVQVLPMSSYITNIQGVLGTDLGLSFVGKTYWLAESSVVDGVVRQIVRSPAVGNGQFAGLKTTVVGPARLKFDWKIDAAPLDYLYLLVNGSIALSRQSFVDWQEISYELPAGTHQIEWRYSKDDTFAFSADAAFLGSISTELFLNYNTWIASYLTGPQLSNPLYYDPTSNPDGDIWTNFHEYVFGGNPLVAETGPLPRYPRLVDDGMGGLAYRFEVPAIYEDLNVVIQESTDLITWIPSPDESVTLVGAMTRHEVPVTQIGTKYFRVYVEFFGGISP